jgi:hypothetical protein
VRWGGSKFATRAVGGEGRASWDRRHPVGSLADQIFDVDLRIANGNVELVNTFRVDGLLPNAGSVKPIAMMVPTVS